MRKRGCGFSCVHRHARDRGEGVRGDPAGPGREQHGVSRSKAKVQTALGRGWRATPGTSQHASLARGWGRPRTFFRSQPGGSFCGKCRQRLRSQVGLSLNFPRI